MLPFKTKRTDRALKTRTPVSSRQWCEHFRRNAVSQMALPWKQGAQLTEAERAAIQRSVQTFQLGESGQGRHLRRVAAEYSARSGDDAYAESMRLFVREEQRHGEYLGRFLDLAGISRLQRHWTNGFFYWIRHRVGLELTISILLTAELMAMVYYAALRRATGSKLLRRICEQLLKDEVAHVRYQCERLALLRVRRTRPAVWATQLIERCFFRGTCLVVWWTHRRAIRAGGLNLSGFWKKAQQELALAQRMMDPRGIAPPHIPHLHKRRSHQPQSQHADCTASPLSDPAGTDLKRES